MVCLYSLPGNGLKFTSPRPKAPRVPIRSQWPSSSQRRSGDRLSTWQHSRTYARLPTTARCVATAACHARSASDAAASTFWVQVESSTPRSAWRGTARVFWLGSRRADGGGGVRGVEAGAWRGGASWPRWQRGHVLTWLGSAHCVWCTTRAYACAWSRPTSLSKLNNPVSNPIMASAAVRAHGYCSAATFCAPWCRVVRGPARPAQRRQTRPGPVPGLQSDARVAAQLVTVFPPWRSASPATIRDCAARVAIRPPPPPLFPIVCVCVCVCVFVLLTTHPPTHSCARARHRQQPTKQADETSFVNYMDASKSYDLAREALVRVTACRTPRREARPKRSPRAHGERLPSLGCVLCLLVAKATHRGSRCALISRLLPWRGVWWHRDATLSSGPWPPAGVASLSTSRGSSTLGRRAAPRPRHARPPDRPPARRVPSPFRPTAQRPVEPCCLAQPPGGRRI